MSRYRWTGTRDVMRADRYLPGAGCDALRALALMASEPGQAPEVVEVRFHAEYAQARAAVVRYVPLGAETAEYLVVPPGWYLSTRGGRLAVRDEEDMRGWEEIP
jgi:hypothetical protein